MKGPDMLHRVTWATLACGAAAAGLGLIWREPGGGLYMRDTVFVQGGAMGSDVVTLGVVLLGIWAMIRWGRASDVALAGAHAWLLYLHAGNALGAVAFNEAFPLYVAAMPLSAWGLALAARRAGRLTPPPGLGTFLAASGIVTAAIWALLLGLEMAGGIAPSAYSVRTTYALDLGVIAPLCLTASWAVSANAPWAMRVAVPLLGLEALLLPMMAAQTAMQVRAGAQFGPEAAAPFLGFGILSALALLFLRRALRGQYQQASL